MRYNRAQIPDLKIENPIPSPVSYVHKHNQKPKPLSDPNCPQSNLSYPSVSDLRKHDDGHRSDHDDRALTSLTICAQSVPRCARSSRFTNVLEPTAVVCMHVEGKPCLSLS
ncbi:hypothetical protein MRB53_005420 [Persea americana]|uniref:Uncharacterized protein n=1 Tax=Persea americana TaxID=3435 RepID=A0ACC2MDB4_PERAE|nr:hypothetical protein MRB53_005420 [Persea americana]